MRLILACLLSVFSGLSFAQEKHALIVAVGTYMPESRISSIASVNDIKYINEALLKQDFSQKNIDTLINASATRLAILHALDEMASRVKKGDVVLLHFSMHGQQIRDQKGEGRDEDDGYDEALIPYDVKKPQYYPGVYHGENHLRDDDLAPKLAAIRNKLGAEGSLLVLIDACHSGTATRAGDFLVARGEPVPFYDPENPMESSINLPVKDNFFDALSAEASNMVVISGSGPHQQNFQTAVTVGETTEQVGSLSYGFYKAMNELQPGSDYQDLFRKIKAFVQSQHPSQIPMVEGNTSQVVFSGKYNPRKELIQLVMTETTPGADTIFSIDKGVMDGLGVGSVVHILSSSGSVMTEGRIVKADHFKAFGISAKPLQKGTAYEARPVSLNFGPLTASVRIKSDSRNASLKKYDQAIRKLLKSYSFIQISDDAEMMIDLDSFSKGLHHLQLIDLADSIRWNRKLRSGEDLSDQDLKDLVGAIRNIIRIRYLRSLPDGGELQQMVQAEILSSENEKLDDPVFYPGESFSLRIVNNSNEKLFYTVLDISPDNQVSVLYPTKTREPADYSIDKRREVVRKLGVSHNTPTGKEFLKIIVSREPLDLRSVFEHRVQRADMNSFQEVLDDLFGKTENATRDVSALKTSEIGIITTGFNVRTR